MQPSEGRVAGCPIERWWWLVPLELLAAHVWRSGLAQALHEGMMELTNELNVVGDRRVERNESKYFGLEQLSR